MHLAFYRDAVKAALASYAIAGKAKRTHWPPESAWVRRLDRYL